MARREVTTAVTMAVLCGVLVVAAVAGWRLLLANPSGSDPAAEDTPAESCPTEKVQPGQRIRASQVQVSVFNAGTRSGLAGETLEALQVRGFRAGEVANAPDDVTVRRVEVWAATRDDAEALLVARQFGRKVQVRAQDVDLGPGVDVVVGDRFRRLVRAPRSLEVRQPQGVCAPIEQPPGDAS